ncbi:MAG: hypothetical protein LH617_02270 [Ramlibacter sp.]|nr:hypothetical protein [Ramlibacter sp.]
MANPSQSKTGEMPDFSEEALTSTRGFTERTGGAWTTQGADSGKLAPPREIGSERSGPSDPDRRNDKNPF